MKLQLFLLTSVALFSPIFAAPAPYPGEQDVDLSTRDVKIPDTKYFYEPSGSLELSHYDIRYFKGETVSYDQRRHTLRYLIRSYLTTFREKNLETWIAHGSLLGWWWNGQIMPWDFDLDTQVSTSTLTWLGDNMNMTIHNYTTVEPDGSESQRQYLLDVNPNHFERVRGNGQNLIDARWIDMQTGLFIDITGLSETNPSGQPGLWSCKNYHRYHTKDLYPLRETVFEGVPALVPYEFDSILTQEYSNRALTSTFHENHRWVPEQKEWTLDPQGSRKGRSQKPDSSRTAPIPKHNHKPASRT